MTVCKNITCCLVLLLLWCTPLVAMNGSDYQIKITNVASSDSTSVCVYPTACWKTVDTSLIVKSISVGIDGTVYGLDANQNVWTIPVGSTAWQASSLSAVAQIDAVTATNVYALSNTSCGNGNFQVYHYNGTGSWVNRGYCASQVAAAPDGTVYRLFSGVVTSTTKDTGTITWTHPSLPSGNGTPIKLAVGSQLNAWLITSTCAIETLSAANTFSVVGGCASDIGTYGDPTQGSEETWVINDGSNVYRYNDSNGSLTAGFTQMGGQLTNIAVGNHYFVLGLRTDLGETYHFNSIKLGVTVEISGYFDCSALPGGCPSGSLHTATIEAHWASGGIGASGSNAGDPNVTLIAQALPNTTDCDPLFGSAGDPECEIQADGNVTCTEMGNVFLQTENPIVTIDIETAYTRLKGSGPLYNCVDGVFGVTCRQPTIPWCLNTAPPGVPDLDPLNIISGPPQWNATWDDEAECARGSIPVIGVTFPWTCSPGLAIRNPLTTKSPLCTYTP